MKKLFVREAYAHWRKTHPRPRLFNLDEGAYRTQGPKPPPEPKPKGPSWWARRGHRVFFRCWPAEFIDMHSGWLAGLFIIMTGGGLTMLAMGIDGLAEHYAAKASPCIDRHAFVAATKAGTAPDGTPVMIPTSWCKQYKPGREGETP